MSAFLYYNERNIMTKHILIVEDEYDMADMICRFMRKEGFKATHIDNGNDVVDFVRTQKPDLVVLDLMLPGKEGTQVCKELRTFTDIPVLMVTAKVSEADRLIGFDLGADDYVCKPFSAMELAMRVHVHLRRAALNQTPENDELTLDADKLKASFNGVVVDLTAIEFSLLSLLKNKPGNIYSRNFILDNIYKDYRVVSDRTVDSHIRNLRKKMKMLTDQHDFVQSVYGAGYRYLPFDG